MLYEEFATPGTKTTRRNYRQEIRNTLGTSSADAPNIEQALRAAKYLDEMIRYASGGNMALLVNVPADQLGSRHLGPTKALDYLRAMKEQTEARRAAKAHDTTGEERGR